MTNIGKYRIEEEIGRGGFGQVYRAFDPAMSRKVAIKILLSQKDPDLLARFRNEASATGKLRHRNIVTVYDYGEFDNQPYIVMEYLEGEDLQMIGASGRTVTLMEKTSIMSQVAEGLQHAHHNGIVHRDVKPGNIMILKDGTAKIMDFGIARALVDSARLTQHGSLLGTLSYMAPEVFQGTDVDHLCDIFSLGVICYELITKKHPFAAEAAGRVIYNITSVNPPAINTLVGDCPPGLDQIVARAIHKDRELRYQSMDDLLLDLAPIRLQLQSKEARGLIEKAEGLLTTQQIPGAQELLRQALVLDPHNRAGRELREKITREANRQLLRDRCDQLMTSAGEHFAAERYPKTIEVLESLIRLDPDRSEALELLEKARAAERKRERVQALIAQARRELEEDKLTGAYRSILECFQHAPENKEAAALMETIRGTIERRERERRLAESLSRVEELIGKGEHEEAENLLTDLEVNYPGAARVRQLAADVRQAIREKKRRAELAAAVDNVRAVLDNRRWKDALAALRQLDLRFPNEPEVRSMIGYAEAELQAQERADYVERIGREMRLACESNDFDGADQLLRNALDSLPGEPAFEAMLERTAQLRAEHEAVLARQAARDRAESLAAGQDFAAALDELDRVPQVEEFPELRELRQRIVGQREAYERAQAIQAARGSIEALVGQNRFKEAAELAAESLARFPGEPTLSAAADMVRAHEAEHARKTRIAAVGEEANRLAKEQDFAAALQVIDDTLRQFVGDSTLLNVRQRIYNEEQEHQRKALARSANTIKEHIERRQYEGAIEAGKEALKRFQGDTIIMSLVDVAQLALAEDLRIAEITKAGADAEELAAKEDFDGALDLIRKTLAHLGSDASLESLEEQIEKKRAEHERLKAAAALLANAKNAEASGDRRGAIGLLQAGIAQYGADPSLQDELVRMRREDERDRAIAAAAESARKQLRAGNPEAALSAIRAAVDKHGSDERLNAISADVKAAIAQRDRERAIRGALGGALELEQLGQLGGAGQLLEQALVKAPADPSLTKELERIREKIAKQAQLDAVLDNVRGLMSEDRLDEAAQAVRDAQPAFPDEAMKKLIADLGEEVQKQERTRAISSALGRIEALRSAGDLEGALRTAGEMLAAHPGEAAIQTVQSAIENEIAVQARQKKIAAIMADAHRLLDQQKVDDAKKKIEAGLAEFPKEAELTALLSYADEVLAARRRADAISQLARKAKKLINEGKAAEAEKLLAEAIAQYPGEESLAALAADATKARIERETQQKIRKAVNASETHRKKKRWTEALAVVDAAVRDLGQDPALLQEREAILAAKKSAEKTEKEQPGKPESAPVSGKTEQIPLPPRTGFPKEETVVVSLDDLKAGAAEVPGKAAAPVAEAKAAVEAPIQAAVKPEAKANPEAKPSGPIVPEGSADRADRADKADKADRADRADSKDKKPEIAAPRPEAERIAVAPGAASRRPLGAVAVILILLAVGVIAYFGLGGLRGGSSDVPPVVESPAPSTPAASEPAPAPPLPARIVNFYADPPFVAPGGTTKICYGVENVKSVRLTPAVADVPPSLERCFDHRPEKTAEFTLIATGMDGVEVSKTLSLTVETQQAEQVGRLRVSAGAGATVRVDGKNVPTDRSGSVLTIPLPAGRYPVVVTKDGFEEFRQTVTIEAGKDRQLTAALKEKPTQIVLSGAPAGANVLVDNVSKGAIPQNGSLTIPTTPGNHTVVLRRDGFNDKTVSNVRVELGEIRTLPGSELQMTAVVVNTPPPAPTPTTPVQPAPTPPANPPAAPPAVTACARDWQALQSSTNLGSLRAFVSRCTNTPEASLAVALVARVEAENERTDFAKLDKTNIAAMTAHVKNYPTGPNVADLNAEIQRREGVSKTMQDLSRAFQNKALPALQSLFQNMTPQQLTGFRSFFNNPDARYALENVSVPKVSENTAEATGTLVSRASARNQAFEDRSYVTITLRRANDGRWLVQNWVVQ